MRWRDKLPPLNKRRRRKFFDQKISFVRILKGFFWKHHCEFHKLTLYSLNRGENSFAFVCVFCFSHCFFFCFFFSWNSLRGHTHSFENPVFFFRRRKKKQHFYAHTRIFPKSLKKQTYPGEKKHHLWT